MACCGCLENVKQILWVASVSGAVRRDVGAARRQSFR
ncbi:hypothetical protein A2U01_0088056, partial [Trifolium medium]|nr:hypothetical protein [Trifolium medium]